MNYAAPMAEHLTAADKRVAGWLESFEAALAAGDADAAAALFAEECYWRDLVTFTWNITTSEGRADVAARPACAGRRARAAALGSRPDGGGSCGVDGDGGSAVMSQRILRTIEGCLPL